ncbi:MAG TPA: CRISPR-associated endonuclease Cas3'', partial [Rhodospirillum rubrum]|nr:CRISPR-associated endonuclease Cas3'' [Rhodospirillum rubrum]
MYYAHSLETGGDKTRWQPAADHAFATGHLAAGFAQSFGAEKAARLAGLLHDLGKYCRAFQARLEGAPERVDHATAGAITVRALLAGSSDRWDRTLGEILSYVIAGHHGGLPDWQGLADRLKADLSGLDPVWRDEIAVAPQGLAPSLTPHPSKERLPFQLAFLGRMIFSCLVDADFKDTEAFYEREAGTRSDRLWPLLPAIIDRLIARFNDHMATKAPLAGEPVSAVTLLRQDVLAQARARAAMSEGLFTLTVPTGGGKTLASLGFALDHAKRHGLERIIFAIPFTSILDQTAAVFRDVLGEGVILEHHSAIEAEEKARREPPQQRDKLRLAMEDWAAPLILTTTVQLFESLFANRPARCRKLHS